jgi:hypothetical protein
MTINPRESTCPMCGESVFPTREVSCVRQDDAHLRLARGDLPEAHLAICAFCTSLLISPQNDGGAYTVVGLRTYQALPADFQQRIQELALLLEQAERPPPGRQRMIIAPRGDRYVAAIVYANGRMIASAPVSTPAAAEKLIKGSEFVDMQLQLVSPGPGLWLSRVVMELFPGRAVELGPWGPYGGEAEAKAAGVQNANEMARQMGAIPLGYRASEPRNQN